MHLKKLQAFLSLYNSQLSRSASQALQGLWNNWNSGDLNTQTPLDPALSGGAAYPPLIAAGSLRSSGEPSGVLLAGTRGGREGFSQGSSTAGQAWPAFAAELSELNRHAQHWSRQLAENNLALNLLDFCAEIGRMRALKSEGQSS